MGKKKVPKNQGDQKDFPSHELNKTKRKEFERGLGKHKKVVFWGEGKNAGGGREPSTVQVGRVDCGGDLNWFTITSSICRGEGPHS